ncbi:6-phosphofructokinase [Cutibacterium acnes]|nr:6-phosphofructokinase [Cutibacterium acnes]
MIATVDRSVVGAIHGRIGTTRHRSGVVMSRKKKVGILTAGGDCPGLNAAIRGFGKAAIRQHDMELIGIQDGFLGLAGNRTISLGPRALSGILTVGGTILGTSRDKVNHMIIDGEERDMVPTIVENYEKLGLDALVTLGGGGTAKNAYKLAKAGLNVLHLPKTIDNDIVGTDDSFGFSTALEIATEAIDRLHSTAHSHHRIILAEIMGHRAGWLALGSGIAGGADVILLPEVPYKLDSIVQAVENRQKQGLNFSVIAVAEGARDEADSAAMAGAQALVDASKTPETKAAAKKDLEHSMRDNTLKLATQLEEATGLESRVSILGYVQRGGIPCAHDRLLATRLGTMGAKLVDDGEFGIMVAAQGGDATTVALKDVAGKVKYVPADHPWVKAARQVGTGLGD